MIAIGQLAFLAPAALIALAVVPIIWWLLRFTPPRPDRIRFPPIRFLLGLVSREETPHKSPWWLTALRTLLAVLAILAAANPVLNPRERVTQGAANIVVVVDSGWASAKTWDRRSEILSQIADEAQGRVQRIAIVETSPASTQATTQWLSPAEFADRIEAMRPQPFAADRAAALAQLEALAAEDEAVEIVWLSDGLDYSEDAIFSESLEQLYGGPASITVYRPQDVAGIVSLGRPVTADGSIEVPLTRPEGATAGAGAVRALALNGRSLGDAGFSFDAGETAATTQFELPVALRNQVARVEIVGARSAAGVYLLDDSWRRKAVGLVSGVTQEIAQPLLSPLYYLERALEPFADIRRPTPSDARSAIRSVLDQGLSALVLADVGHILQNDLEALEQWVEDGGIVIRFAGPRLASGTEQLIPVALRKGDRALGGALSWSEPQRLSPFETDSPFFSLDAPEEVIVNRQVLAQPSADLADRTWARLTDGTPLVTAAARGNGLLVLFHVPANPEWSNLPISGLFVEMLRRIVDLSQGVSASAAQAQTTSTLALTSYTPMRTLNGFGELTDPPPDASPIATERLASTRPQPSHPPGLYRRGGHLHALNVADENVVPVAAGPLPGGAEARSYTTNGQEPLRGYLFLGALVLLLIDGLAVLALSGRFSSQIAARGTAAALLLFAATAAVPQARAQDAAESLSAADEFALNAALETRLGYVITGNTTIDQISLAGLTGLSSILLERTALEPGGPVGLNIERDDIVFFPLIYWPVPPDAPPLSEQTSAKIDVYLKNGGTIFFDTRDHQVNVPNLRADELSAAQMSLRRILSNLDIPPLEVVPADHVLTKAFYLLQSFPGRWEGGHLWVEASRTDAEDMHRRGSSNFDGVSSIIIGSNDYASAWAVDLRGQPLFPVVPGGARQREMSFRTGINIVMYSLTGNYKADQVHVPALLERLGQ